MRSHRRMKLIHHAIRMAAFNTAQSLARAIATGTGYARADDEAHALIRTALAGAEGHHPRPTRARSTSGSTRYRHQARDAAQFP